MKRRLHVVAAIVFVLREILIGIFKHEMEVPFLAAMIALMLVLGIMRTLTVVFASGSQKSD